MPVVSIDDLNRQMASPVPASPNAPTVADVRTRARELGINPDLAASILTQESGGNFGVHDSSAGAIGGMQVMPATADFVNQRLGTHLDPGNPWDNMELGLQYLRYGKQKLGTSDPRLLAAGYHQGYNRPELQQGRIADTSDGSISTPQYAQEVTSRVNQASPVAGTRDPNAAYLQQLKAQGLSFKDLAPQGAPIASPTSQGDAVNSEAVGGSVQMPTLQGTSSPGQPAGDPNAGYLQALKAQGLTLVAPKPPSEPAPQQASPGTLSGLAGDTGKLFKIGSDQLVQGVRELVRKIPGVGESIVGALDKVDQTLNGEPTDQLLNDDIKQMTQSLSPEMQAAMKKNFFDKNGRFGIFGSAWSDPRAYLGGIVESLPAEIVSILPAVRIAKGIYAGALAKNLAAGMAESDAAAAAAKTAAWASGVVGGTAEGAIQGGQSSQQVRSDIMNMPIDELRKSDAFNTLVKSGMSENAARKSLAESASTQAMALSGIATGVFSGFGDSVLGKALTHGLEGGLVKRILKGAAAEGPLEEFPQSYLSQVAQNYAEKKANPDIPLTQGAMEQGLQGLAVGSAQGGMMTGAFGHRANVAENAPVPASEVLGQETSAPAENESSETSQASAPGTAPVEQIAPTIQPAAGERSQQQVSTPPVASTRESSGQQQPIASAPAAPTAPEQAITVAQPKTSSAEPATIAGGKVADLSDAFLRYAATRGGEQVKQAASRELASRTQARNSGPQPQDREWIGKLLAGKPLDAAEGSRAVQLGFGFPIGNGKWRVTQAARDYQKSIGPDLRSSVVAFRERQEPSLNQKANEAATSENNELPQPSEAQKDAGNYQKGHINISGLDISIENPAGSKRRPEWPALKSHYGYIRQTTDHDGEHTDVFVKPGTSEDYNGPVFVVDQKNRDGSFNEHKALVGWKDEDSARKGYLENYTKGWNGIKGIAAFDSVDEFKRWLKEGNTRRPAAPQVQQASEEVPFSRLATSKQSGLPVDRVKHVVRLATAKWRNKPDIHVVQSAKEVPDDAAPSNIEGAYTGDGHIYLVADNLHTPQRVREVLAHEAVGHHGFEQVFGMSFDDLADAVERAEKNGRMPVVRSAEHVDRTQPGLSRTERAREIVAAMAENGEHQIIPMRLLAALRRFLRNIGVNLKLSMSDLTSYLNQAERHLRKAAPANAAHVESQPTVHYSRADSRTPNREKHSAAASVGLSVARGAVSAMRPAGAVFDITNQALESVGKALFAPVTPLTSHLYDRLRDATSNFMHAGPIRSRIAHGVVADYGLPEPYLVARHERERAVNAELRKSKELLEEIASIDRSEARIAYLWMQEKPVKGQESQLLGQLPQAAQETLARMKDMIDRLGTEAVKLELLTPESYERNRMAYLHRSYKKYELDDPVAVARTVRSKTIRAQSYMGRGLRDDIAAARLPDARQGEKYMRLELRAAPEEKGSIGELKRVAYVKQGEPVPKRYSDWRYDGLWEARWFDKKGQIGMWRDLTKKEREALGEIEEVRYAFARTMIAAVHDIETARFLKWIAENHAKADESEVTAAGGKLAEAVDSLVTLSSYADDEWVQVPAGYVTGTKIRRYGALAGKFVPGHMWNDIRSLINTRSTSMVWRLYDQLLKAWKISKTALSPVVHTNNVLSNFVLADLADVSAHDMRRALTLLIDAKRGKADAKTLLDRYYESGAEGGSFVGNELRADVIQPILDDLQGEQNELLARLSLVQAIQLAWKRSPAEALAAFRAKRGVQFASLPLKAMINLYRREDSVFRLAKFLKEIDSGKTDFDAGRAARRSFLDYSINAPWIQALRRGPLPFLAFTYRVAPLLIEAAAKRPWKMMKYFAVGYALNALAYAMLGAAGDEERERELLPDEKSGNIFGVFPRLLRMPWNDAHGSPVFLDVRRWVPGGDIVDLTGGHGVLPMPSWLSVGGPIGLLIELASNKDMYTGKPILLETDTAAEKAAKLSDYLFKFLAPNWPLPDPPGYAIGFPYGDTRLFQTYSWNAIQNAGNGVTDAFGREKSMRQAILSAFGVKLGSYPADVGIRNAREERDAKLREINIEASRTRREYTRHGISSAQFQQRMKRQADKRREVQREFMDKISH